MFTFRGFAEQQSKSKCFIVHITGWFFQGSQIILSIGFMKVAWGLQTELKL